MTNLVEVRGVTKQYVLGKNVVPALRGVDLDVHLGEFLAIVGPSGSGKTTLLHLIGCIESPTQGSILFDGVNVSSLKSSDLYRLRAEKLSFIFQSFNLLAVLTAFENVEYPLFEKKLSARERKEKAEAALAAVGLADHMKHKPMEMSGGQRQRVAIARALVSEPRLILADEPTANLDHETGNEILDLMQKINQERGTTFIFSTHDSKVMERASRQVHMWDGALK